MGASAYIRLRKMPFTNLQHLPSTESRLNQVGRLWLNEIHRIEKERVRNNMATQCPSRRREGITENIIKDENNENNNLQVETAS